jgi:O-acetyl-ADP-ribose deacetylase (regulator of RNase III)
MIRTTTGDITAFEADAIVNTVNCVGVMGRGVALRFKQVFPANFDVYAAACARGEVVPGRMLVVPTGRLTAPRYIVNFPTKRHWRGQSRLDDIRAGLVALVDEVRRLQIRSIALPPLGSGLGGLDWRVVRPLVIAAFEATPDVEVTIFEPRASDAPPLISPATPAPKITPGRAALVAMMDRYFAALLDPGISLLEVHKLMYFLQAAGEGLRLQFRKALYGPYAENLRHVLRHVEGHLVRGYEDGGDAPTKPLELVEGAVDAATPVLDASPETRARIDRVERLVDGFETPFGMELLSTVHWVVTEERASSDDEIARAVYAWNERKRRFTREQIRLASERLRAEGWIGRA